MDRPVHHRPSEHSVLSLANRTDLLFVTVCTKDRQPILANKKVVDVILNSWLEASHWLVGKYVIMPDHVHFFCVPNVLDPNLKRWISYWKRLVTQEIGTVSKGLWQSGLWDTQIRTGKMYEEKWEYVRHNPVRHRLVAEPEDWKFAGELNLLEWHGG